MARSNNGNIPKFIRPYVSEEDRVRFHNLYLAGNFGSYSDTISLLLDVYDEIGNDNINLQAIQVANLVNDFKKQLKAISPGLLAKFEEKIQNGTGN